MDTWRVMIYTGDCLEILPTLEAESVQTVVTSPPYYGLRNYGVEGQIGLERDYLEYVEKLVLIFREVWRVLRLDGTLWLNLGDSYASGKGTCFNPGGNTSSFNVHLKEANVHPLDRGNKSTLEAVGLKPKDLIGIPWRVAFALQADGWYLRQDIIWAKPNPMPESVTDRCTKAHEYIFLLTKQAKYFYDAEAVKEDFADERKGNPGRYNWKQGAGNVAGVGPNSLHKGNGIVEGWNIEGKATGRNRRSVWTITTKPFKEAHFATFPPKIPEICIKAGTSEKGCCPECGSPWVRTQNIIGRQITDSMRVAGCNQQGEYEGQATKDYESGKAQNASDTKRRILESMSQVKEYGWRSTCAHDLDPVPCTILDPFSGAGTTGMVAEKLGRKYIGIELNPAYSEMAEKRIEAVRLPLLEAL